MTVSTDIVSSRSLVPASKKSYAKIAHVLEIPHLINMQLDSYDWFQKEGLRELLRRDLADPGLHRHQHGAALRRVLLRRAEVRRAGVPRARHDLRGAAARQRRAHRQGDRRGQGAGALHGRLPAHDAERHLHHQRRRARRRLAARALAGRLLHAGDGPDDRPRALLRQADPEPRRLARVRDLATRTSSRSRSTASARSRSRRCCAPSTRRRACPRRELGTNERILAKFADVDTNPDHQLHRDDAREGAATNKTEALLEFYRRLRPGDPPTLENARAPGATRCSSTRAATTCGRVGRYKLNRRLELETPTGRSASSSRDDLEAHHPRRMITLNNGDGDADDIDHLGNRRVRAVGELIQNQFRIGLLRMERVVRERMTITDPDQATPSALINIRPVVAVDEGVLRRLAALAVHGPDEPAGGADAQAPPLGAGPRRSVARPRRLRRARRAPQPLRPHLPDRDAGRPEHRPDRLAGDVWRDQRLRLHRDAVPPRDQASCRPTRPELRRPLPRARTSSTAARRWPRPATRSTTRSRRSWRRWATSTSRCRPFVIARDRATWRPTTKSSYVIAQANALLDDDGHFLEERRSRSARASASMIEPPGQDRLHGRLAEADPVRRRRRSSRSWSTTTRPAP